MREHPLHRARRRTGLTRFGVIVALAYVLATALVLVGVSSARADDWHQETSALEAVPAWQDHGDAPAVSPSPPPAAERFRPSTRGEVRAVLVDAAHRHGADAATVVRVADCESGLDPAARGDYVRGVPTSWGLIQLNDWRGTGLLHHFLAVGYTDALDAEQAADYLARVAAGEWRRDGVSLARWSCFWVRR